MTTQNPTRPDAPTAKSRVSSLGRCPPHPPLRQLPLPAPCRVGPGIPQQTGPPTTPPSPTRWTELEWSTKPTPRFLVRRSSDFWGRRNVAPGTTLFRGREIVSVGVRSPRWRVGRTTRLTPYRQGTPNRDGGGRRRPSARRRGRRCRVPLHGSEVGRDTPQPEGRGVTVEPDVKDALWDR